MSLDGISVYAQAIECSNEVVGEKIEKIYQLSSMELVFVIRKKKLFISGMSDKARINLTERRFENPQNPPRFCMLLRKHFIGGRIVSLKQRGMDRIVEMQVENYDELGNLSVKTLMIIMTGRTSNIILLNEDGKVIDLMKRVYGDVSETAILPGMEYFPEKTDKALLTEIEFEDFKIRLLKENKSLRNFLIGNYEGVGPTTAKELIFRAGMESDLPTGALSDEEIEEFYRILEEFKYDLINHNFSPICVYKNTQLTEVEACYPFQLTYYKNFKIKEFATMSEMLETAYAHKDNSDMIHNYSQHLRKLTNNLIKKLEKKLQKQKLELLEAKDRDKYKMYADLLQSNLYREYNNEDSIIVQNFYDLEMSDIEIPLDSTLSLPNNAQKYYKLFQKNKNREQLLSKEIPKAEREKAYLEQIKLSLEQITQKSEVEEIKEELEDAGYIKKPKKRKKSVPSKPLKFESSNGLTIMVGKNNRQNDELTFDIAKADDIWMHIRNMPGSHVIIRTEGKDVPDFILEEGAYLAKYYSTAKNMDHASVDYTTKKNVKRMRGGKPGMVNYYEFKTIYISSDINIYNRIEKI